MKLYFRHSNGDMDFICDIDGEKGYIDKALDDLEKRAPHFHSYYQRIWKDKDGWTWIDVGDHYCFYILKDD